MKHEIYMLLNYFYYFIKKAQHEMHNNIIYSPHRQKIGTLTLILQILYISLLIKLVPLR